MRRKGKTSEKGRGARLLVAAVALLVALLASCDNLITRTPPADVGGGYAAEANSAGSGALTVTASVSGGASRHAMPSLEVSDFAYAALLYQDDSDEKGEFAKGDVAGEKTLSFSFTRPEDPSGGFTLEIFAFEKDTYEKDFSRTTAILSGSAPVKVGTADTISISKPVPLEVNSSYTGTTGTVSLKVQVPAGCTLKISGDDAEKFKCEEDESTPNTYTISQNGDGIEAGAYPLTLTVEKGGSPLYVLSEYINVLPGMCTNKWSDTTSDDGARVISEASFSTTVYVRGTGGWYDNTSPYNEGDTAVAKDENFGSFLAPLETIQKAVDKVLAMNDGTSEYTIYVDGVLECDDKTYTGANGMADFSALKKDLNLTIKALSGTATLDAGARFTVDESGGVSVTKSGIGKRVIYAKPTSGALDLTLENLAIKGGNASSDSGGGIYANGISLTIEGCAISGNTAKYGGGVYANGGSLTVNGCTISENIAYSGGGIYVSVGGTLTMDDATAIVKNTASGYDTDNELKGYGGAIYVNKSTLVMKGGKISENNATTSGAIYVNNGTFTMEGGEISKNTAKFAGGVYASTTSTLNIANGTISENEADYGGGFYLNYDSTLTMNGGDISKNNAKSGGGVYLNNGSTFDMKGGEIRENNANYGGGFYVCNNSTLNMSAGSISGNNADTNGGGVYVYFSSTELTNTGTKFTMQGGEISKNIATHGGGVYVYSGGTFDMQGGTIYDNEATGTNTNSGGGGVYVTGSGTYNMSGDAKISGNTAEKYGGGVYVTGSGSKFNMTGGTIGGSADEKNTASQGGGVYVADKAAFTMESGAINANEATMYGGVYIVNSGSIFNMSGGEISGNIATSANTNGGGGVCVSSGTTFNMSGGEISLNTTNVFGGGVFVGGTFNMSGNAKITENTGIYRGGGIYVTGGTVTISGGTISANKSTSSSTYYGSGGGIFVSSGTVTMTGGTISGNTAKNMGGGVYVNDSDTFNMSGDAKVDADNDVYLGGDTTYATITVAGELKAATPVATITPASYAEGTQVLSADGVTLTQAICDKFELSDDSWTIDFNGTSGVLKKKMDTVYLNSSTGADTNSGTSASEAVATLLRAMRLSAREIIVCATYTLPSDEASLLNRSGGGKSPLTLSRYESFIGNMLEISQNVTISNITLDGNKDRVSASGFCLYVYGSSTTVTFGSDAVARNNKTGQRGSGVYISSGTFKMTNGSLVDGNQATYGGGVYVNDNGTFEMSGGVISGNKATVSGYGGGGAYVRGTVKMSGGEISGNTADYGGGMYVASAGGGTLTMTGGKITGNTATSKGGGVYVTGTFTMKGGEITGNTAATSGNGVSGTFTHTGGTVQED